MLKEKANGKAIEVVEKKTFEEKVSEWTDAHPKATKTIKVVTGVVVALGGLVGAYVIGKNSVDVDCSEREELPGSSEEPFEAAAEVVAESIPETESVEVEVTEF